MSVANHISVDLSRFPESDGIPLETTWHRAAMNVLIGLTRPCLRPREDFFAGGNQFIYYDQNDPKKVVGPDYFLVKGVPPTAHSARPIWAVWAEGDHYPDVIVEFLSPSTAKTDRTTKKDLYQRIFKTAEYFIYDPDKQKLEGWRLIEDEYVPIEANEKGWLWSEELSAWIGTWEGVIDGVPDVWLRFYDENGEVIPTEAEEQRQLAEELEERAEQERERAKQERERAAAAEAEVERLKALLEKQGPPSEEAD